MFRRTVNHRSARARITALLAIASFVLLAGAGAASAAVSQIEKTVTSRAYGELGVYEYPAGSNHPVDANGVKQPYDISPNATQSSAWCASFINWVMQSSGIEPHNSARGTTWNVNVAKAWSVYGWKGGGYGRMGTKHDAMPGDLLIDNYDGTATVGGHISMVIGPHPDGTRYVWTVGGNEGDKVRLQRKDLDASSRYLVTMFEFRTRRVDLWNEYNTRVTDVGDVYFSRYFADGAARLRVNKVVTSTGVVYSPTSSPTLHDSSYRTLGSNGTYYAADQIFRSDSFSWIWLEQGAYNSATLAVPPTAIDPSKASSSSSTS